MTAQAIAVEPVPAPAHRVGWRLALLFAVALVACAGAYLVAAVPGRWFPGVAARQVPAAQLAMANGRGTLRGDELFVVAPDAAGTSIIVAPADVRAHDYPTVAWIAIDVPDDADVRLIWRTDLQPGKLNSAPLTVASGRLLPVTLTKDPAWIGRITGLGLAIRAPLPQPVRIRGLVAKPMGALDLVADRWREWFAVEGWTGVSINSVTGGADVQDLPLPLLLFAAVALAGGGVLLLARVRPQWLGVQPAVGIAVLALVAWLLLDARWTWNLASTVAATGAQYAGKDWREKHLAADDGALFAFTEKVRSRLPDKPARVFVVADAHYFRGRAAYHLYPHNVFHDPYRNDVPPADRLRAGDWIVVYQRRGVQFDRDQQMLRWDGGATVPVELVLADAGAALFRVR